MQFIYFFDGKIHKYVYHAAFNFSLETIEHKKYIFSISTVLIIKYIVQFNLSIFPLTIQYNFT